jgi:hypothetical protein
MISSVPSIPSGNKILFASDEDGLDNVDVI